MTIPNSPLKDTLPPRELADPDSQFIEINGLDIHVKTMGQGEPAFVLLHGFGASLYSWNPIMEPLNHLGRVIAYDRPAFGLTERPLHWEGQNPYGPEAQVGLVTELLDHFGLQRVILVGHSAGGPIAMQVALDQPERVTALILVDPAVFGNNGAPTWLHPLLAAPLMRRLGLLFIRQIQHRGPKLLKMAWHDPSNIKPETVDLYTRALHADNWDTALWEFTLASHASHLPEQLDQLTLPILVITGDDDRIIPTADSLRLSKELPNAQLVVIRKAGHVPHEEQPADFMDALRNFLNTISL
jgi:pimeloyl-ACP methyl ester carboxylesterase